MRPGEELDWAALERLPRRADIDGLDGRLSRCCSSRTARPTSPTSLRSATRRFVVRRPPFGRIAPGAHDMSGSTARCRGCGGLPAAPRAFAFCDDHDVVGSRLPGDRVPPRRRDLGRVPPSMAHHADVGRRVGLAVVDALADLHLVDPAALRPRPISVGPTASSSARSPAGAKRWELAAPPDADRRDAGGRRPPGSDDAGVARASILHNDYKLDNCQFDPADPDRVKSVFDWDQATLGDPFVDVGTLLNYWPDPADTPGRPAPSRPGHGDARACRPGPRSSSATPRAPGFDVGASRWYEAFACWKTAVIFQQLYQRYVRGESTDERMATPRRPHRHAVRGGPPASWARAERSAGGCRST